MPEKTIINSLIGFSKQVALEFGVVSIIIFLGLIIELSKRGILFLEDGSLNSDIFYFAIDDTIVVTIIFVVTFRFLQSSYYRLGAVLLQRYVVIEKNKIIATLSNIFFITALLLSTTPIRPVIHATYLEYDIPNFQYDLVKYDGFVTFILLSVIGLALAILIYKRKEDPLRGLKIFGLVFVVLSATILNSSSNFYARVIETSASWVRRDWEEQTSTGELALSVAKTDEEKATAYFWLGVAENRKGDYEKAIEYQQKAINLLPDYGAAHASLANAYLGINEYQKSFEHSQKCIYYNPEYAWCYHALYNYYFVTGNKEEALRNIKKAVNLDSENRELKDTYREILESTR